MKPSPQCREFHASGFALLRTPLLPFADYRRWSESQGSIRAPFKAPLLREALRVASPALLQRLDATDDGRRIDAALLRYFARACARPTPFGLFAGCTLVRCAERTALSLPPREAAVRRVRLDMGYLTALSAALLEDPEVREAAMLRPNSSLYQVGQRWHYVESRVTPTGREFQLVGVESIDYLDRTLQRAADGARVATLVEGLCNDDSEIALDDARAFVHEMIDTQLLVPDWEPRVTGSNALEAFIARVPRTSATSRSLKALRDAGRALTTLESSAWGAADERYDAVEAPLRQLPVTIDPSRLIQVDLFKPAADVSLGPALVDAYRQAAELLWRLQRRQIDRAQAFRESFMARYERREVPLSEALDEEAGIGFESIDTPSTAAAPLLEGMELAAARAEERVPWGARESHLLRRLHATLSAGEHSLELSPADIDALATPSPMPLPDAFAVMGRVIAHDAAAIDRGEFKLLLDYAVGPSGATLLGRFCHGDEELAQAVREHLREEQAHRPAAVYAEIVHLPEGRLGNVLLRPVLREYEIPFLGASSAPKDKQLELSDLLLCVEGERIVLRSRRLGCEVQPRLTSAHNYDARSLGLYRLLCVLQTQGCAGGMAWNWGPLESAPFLPRVTQDKLILARARWNLDQHEIGTVTAANEKAGLAAVFEWRAARGIPRWVILAEDDQELTLDLDNALCVTTLLLQVRESSRAVLLESLSSPQSLCVESPEGRLTHELLVPFVCTPTAPLTKPRSRIVTGQSEGVSRRFTPGSDWVFASLYAGPATIDRLLIETVPPLLETLRQADALRHWFFVRYADPDWHLRLRLFGDAAALHALALPMLDSSLAWRVRLDTYEPEIERYGGRLGMQLVERLFCADSEAALRVIASYPANEGLDVRWRVALRGVDLLLDDLGLDQPAKLGVLQQMAASFVSEFEHNANLKQQLATKQRALHHDVAEALSTTVAADHALSSGADALTQRTADWRETITLLQQAETAGHLTLTLPELAGSLAHMHVNRMLRSAHRAHELVLYDLLARHHRSQAARRR